MESLLIFILFVLAMIILLYQPRHLYLTNSKKPNQIINHQLEIKTNQKTKDNRIQFQSPFIFMNQKCIQSGRLQGDRISLVECNPNDPYQKWSIKGQQIQSLENHLCMETIMNNDQIRMWDCDSDLQAQKWNWTL